MNDVEICNLALAHLGDTGTIASIAPPENSIQAMHCARFYPVARDALLEMHPWSFATRRVALTPLSVTNAQWRYVYSKPNLMLRALAVIPPDAWNDYTVPVMDGEGGVTTPASGSYVPQPYSLETLSNGELVICTNVENAVLRYIVAVVDPTRFSPTFTICLSWFLASMLAGPIMKGDVGMAEGKRCYQMLQVLLTQATSIDTNQRQVKPVQVVPWLAGR